MRRFLPAVLIALLMVACGGDTATTTTGASSTTTTSTLAASTSTSVTVTTLAETTTTALEIDVTVTNGEVDGPDLFEFALGDLVEITVLIDVADEIHVHGYDLSFDAEPGTPVEITFAADAQGIFEVELETNHLLLFEIQVTP